MESNFQDKTLYVLNNLSKFLIINSPFSPNAGLLEGKLGASLFLYNHDFLNESPVLFNLANELLLDSINRVNKHQLNYASGASGIAWGIHYLVRKEFVDVDSENIFHNIDTILTREAFDLDVNRDSLEITLSILGRFSSLEYQGEDFYEELNFLLKKERIVGHIDKIHLDDLLKTRILQTPFIEELQTSQGALSFMIMVENLTTVAILLIRAHPKQMFPEITNILLKDVYNMIKDLLNNLFALIRDVEIVKIDSTILQYLLTRLYNAFLQISTVVKENNLSMEFVSALQTITMEVTRFSNELKASSELLLYTLSCTCRINSILKNDFLQNYILNKIELEILNVNLPEFYSSFLRKENLNIGLSGLAGVGMILLQQLDKRFEDWNEGLLIF